MWSTGHLALYHSSKNWHPHSYDFPVFAWSKSFFIPSLNHSWVDLVFSSTLFRKSFLALYAFAFSIVLIVHSTHYQEQCFLSYPVNMSIPGGFLFLPMGKYAKQALNCRPSPTLIPWPLWIVVDLHSHSGIANDDHGLWKPVHSKFLQTIGEEDSNSPSPRWAISKAPSIICCQCWKYLML